MLAIGGADLSVSIFDAENIRVSPLRDSRAASFRLTACQLMLEYSRSLCSLYSQRMTSLRHVYDSLQIPLFSSPEAPITLSGSSQRIKPCIHVSLTIFLPALALSGESVMLISFLVCLSTTCILADYPSRASRPVHSYSFAAVCRRQDSRDWAETPACLRSVSVKGGKEERVEGVMVDALLDIRAFQLLCRL
jgi:hypothetical protein